MLTQSRDEIKQNIEQLFQEIPGLFITEKSRDINGAYQVIFTDIDYPWHTKIEGTKCSSHQGVHPQPVVTMLLSSSDFANITYGRLNETAALMSGKIKLQGNLIQAIKYSKLFRKLEV
jgi:putative sterol carrier protein